jgi:DNA-binding transcriptional LysR family regulator
MHAKTQYKLSAIDLATILALVRTGTLALAGERLGIDASTVFRSIQRIERGLEQSLFERSRTGFQPSELAQILAEHAERMEAQLESAHSAVQMEPEQMSGTVKITTTDTILHGLVAPALKTLQTSHPLLAYELHTGNELASLTRRDADIAIRATKQPPQHLIGKRVGIIQMALFVAKNGPVRDFKEVEEGKAHWIAPDDVLPEHPGVLWRRQHFPAVSPRYRVNSILTVMELVALGLGIGIVPIFLARLRPDLVQLTEVIDQCQTELWLLTHPESRHLRRVATVFRHLSLTLSL